MSRVVKNKNSALLSKAINMGVIGVILFWSAFWPTAYMVSENVNDNIKKNIRNSEYLPTKEKIRILGE